MALDETAEELLREENPTAEAVRSLIKVKDRIKGQSSDVELKTELDSDGVNIHTVLQSLSNTLEMDESSFNSKCILSDIIDTKERKLISKDRKSRMEIVNVARQPDMNMLPEQQQGGFLRRFFKGKQQPPM